MRAGWLGLLAALACAEPGGSLHVWVERGSPAIRDGVLRESVGIETGRGEVTPILSAGCELPCEERVQFGTFEDDQREILIYVFRGNTSTTASSTALGVYEIANLPPGTAGSRDVAVRFRAADGDLSLRAEPLEGAEIALRAVDP